MTTEKTIKGSYKPDVINPSGVAKFRASIPKNRELKLIGGFLCDPIDSTPLISDNGSYLTSISDLGTESYSWAAPKGYPIAKQVSQDMLDREKRGGKLPKLTITTDDGDVTTKISYDATPKRIDYMKKNHASSYVESNEEPVKPSDGFCHCSGYGEGFKAGLEYQATAITTDNLTPERAKAFEQAMGIDDTKSEPFKQHKFKALNLTDEQIKNWKEAMGIVGNGYTDADIEKMRADSKKHDPATIAKWLAGPGAVDYGEAARAFFDVARGSKESAKAFKEAISGIGKTDHDSYTTEEVDTLHNALMNSVYNKNEIDTIIKTLRSDTYCRGDVTQVINDNTSHIFGKVYHKDIIDEKIADLKEQLRHPISTFREQLADLESKIASKADAHVTGSHVNPDGTKPEVIKAKGGFEILTASGYKKVDRFADIDGAIFRRDNNDNWVRACETNKQVITQNADGSMEINTTGGWRKVSHFSDDGHAVYKLIEGEWMRAGNVTSLGKAGRAHIGYQTINYMPKQNAERIANIMAKAGIVCSVEVQDGMKDHLANLIIGHEAEPIPPIELEDMYEDCCSRLSAAFDKLGINWSFRAQTGKRDHLYTLSIGGNKKTD